MQGTPPVKSLYPNSANAQVALGDFWLAKKDTVKARGYFEKAMALRPGVKRAKDAVEKLTRASRSP